MRTEGLSEYQMKLVEESFAAATAHSAALAARFYQRLVQNFPQAKQALAGYDAQIVQKRMLGSLVLLVENLHTPEKLQPALDQWGDFYRHHELEPSIHWALGSTLLRTLAEFTGDIWGSELEEAWSAAFTEISRRMRAAADGARS